MFEYCDDYSVTSGNLWNYYRDEVNDDENENDNANNRINNGKLITSKSFEHKTKSKGRTPDDNNMLDTEVPLKYLGGFWRFFNFPLINCEITVKKLDLSWSKECMISEISITTQSSC